MEVCERCKDTENEGYSRLLTPPCAHALAMDAWEALVCDSCFREWVAFTWKDKDCLALRRTERELTVNLSLQIEPTATMSKLELRDHLVREIYLKAARWVRDDQS